MRKLFLIIIIGFTIQAQLLSQTGFTFGTVTGKFDNIDLSNAAQTLVGTGQTQINASDFGPNNVLYGINTTTNDFLEIDTTNGSSTVLGNNPPPVNHTWTGLAYDEDSQIMYGMSCYSVATGESSLYTIDITDGSYTLVGSQSDATAIACIAIDDDGQMYGMNLSGNAKIYLIDKTDGSVTELGSTGQGAAGMGHGMDYCSENQTMYLTTYNSMTFVNTLRIVDLTNGSTTEVGELLNGWTGAIAIPAPFNPAFSSDVTEVCLGGTVNFTDETIGSTAWNWTFEGGTPATSTEQNPAVVYNSTGTFNVTLEVWSGSTSGTVSENDYITVSDTPAEPNEPEGDNGCTGQTTLYTTDAVEFAETYIWEVLPADAGTIEGDGTTGTFSASNTWTGDYTIKVQASNDCGTSGWSPEKECTLSESPLEFNLSEGGSYCEGGDGVEITLDGSETGVDYSLYFGGDVVGGPIAGTGDEISFGFFTEAGYYSSDGTNGNCTSFMVGDALISIDNLPATAATPEGPEEICSEETSDYTIEEVEGALSYVWTLSPEEAGTISGDGLTGTVTWSGTYEGEAEVAAHGENDCGTGGSEGALIVMVYSEPAPVITGDNLVCQLAEGEYSVEYSGYSTYEWTVDGGEITSGQGTNEITVYWTAAQGSTTFVNVSESKIEGCEGTAETFEVTIDECVGVEETSEGSISIFPNPVKNILNVKMENIGSSAIELTIINAQGKTALSKKINTKSASTTKMDVSNLAPGIYFVSIKSDHIQIESRKILITK